MLTSLLGWAAWSAVISGISAWLVTSRTISFNREKMRREFQLEFATEAALRSLLADGNYEMRSFAKIKHHLPGFADDNDLRRHLIRAGAVSFMNGTNEEMWGLLEKHKGVAFK
jgi:hypothetical protein